MQEEEEDEGWLACIPGILAVSQGLVGNTRDHHPPHTPLPLYYKRCCTLHPSVSAPYSVDRHRSIVGRKSKSGSSLFLTLPEILKTFSSSNCWIVAIQPTNVCWNNCGQCTRKHFFTVFSGSVFGIRIRIQSSIEYGMGRLRNTGTGKQSTKWTTVLKRTNNKKLLGKKHIWQS